jgi:hypothetical protein
MGLVNLAIQVFRTTHSEPVIFFLAARLTNLRVALTTVMVYTADPVIVLYSYIGMTETLGIFLLLTWFSLPSRMIFNHGVGS